MSETKPTSGDATLDALVRDLSAKVKATDGRWVAENEPKEGAKSIYDDFEENFKRAQEEVKDDIKAVEESIIHNPNDKDLEDDDEEEEVDGDDPHEQQYR